jgi:hypothetical protein
MAHKGPFGILEVPLAPPDDQGGMDLILARRLGRSFPGFDLAHDLHCERTGKAAAFES